MMWGMDVEFGGLGPVEVRISGRPVALGSPKQRAIFGVLLINAGSSVSVDRLVDDVWGGTGPSAPARNVQVYVSALRALLGPQARLLETTSTGYRLAASDEQVDVRRFEAAATEARELLTAGEMDRAASVAADGLSLWRGDAFSDLTDFGFARVEAGRLEALRIDAREDRLEAELALGRHREVLAELEQLVELYPLRERLRGQLMLALHRSGRQADALAVYQAGRRHLVDELGLDPGQALQDVHRSVLRDDPALHLESAELRARRHLPAPVTALVGRRAEITALAATLRATDARLVTATGPGGIGKTRLALQAAHEVADAFRDGVHFIALAALRDPDLVLPTIATVLGVEESPEKPLVAALQSHLAPRQLLLLLDNVEHVDEAAPELAQLLTAAPDVTMLATSRTRLRLYGEHEYPVPQLALHEEAVPLFNARARAADPDWRDDRFPDAVAAICQRLDCLPLAIELAAARVPDIPMPQMSVALSRRLELADSGPRDLAPRQRSLRAAIDWSFQLLPEREQQVFTALAVFAGGCTPSAAEVICGASGTHLSALVAKNLVLRRVSKQAETGETMRFDLLETIREYGLEQLERNTSMAVGVRQRHALYFVELAETASDEIRGPNQLEWMSRLDAERENLRAALTYLTDDAVPGDDTDEAALRLAAALGFYWYKTGSVAEGTGWLERALDASPTAPALLRGRGLHALGILTAESGDDVRALALCETSCELFRQAGETAWVARSLNSQGGIARDTGDLDRAERMYAESADLRRSLGDDDHASLAVVLCNLMMVALDRRDFVTARLTGEEVLAMAAASDQWTHAVTLQTLADVAVEEHDLSRARDLLQHALPVLRQLGPYRLVEYVDSCAGLSAAQGRPDVAARLMGAAEAALDAMGAQIVPADALLRERRAEAALRQLGAHAFAELRGAGRSLPLEAAIELAELQVLATPEP